MYHGLSRLTKLFNIFQKCILNKMFYCVKLFKFYKFVIYFWQWLIWSFGKLFPLKNSKFRRAAFESNKCFRKHYIFMSLYIVKSRRRTALFLNDFDLKLIGQSKKQGIYFTIVFVNRFWLDEIHENLLIWNIYKYSFFILFIFQFETYKNAANSSLTDQFTSFSLLIGFFSAVFKIFLVFWAFRK